MITIKKSNITFDSVQKEEYVPKDENFKKANCLILPYKNFRDGVDYCFSEYAREVLEYLKENSDDCIYSFKERTGIPQNYFYLLKLMQKNKDMLLSIKDIQNLYKENGKEISEGSIKVLLSTLRKYIREDRECNFLIYNEKDMYRFIRYKI